MTREMRRDLRPVVVPLLAAVIRNEGALTQEQRSLVGAAARRVLTFAWGEERRDPGMVQIGIEAACRTYESAPGESEPVLRRTIEPAHLAAHGFEEMPIVARELKRLIPFNPAYVEAVFRAVLSFDEQSEASTSIGGESVLMGLRSNRRQDYRMAHYTLGEMFPQFMAAAPVQATGAVIAAVEAQVAPYAMVPMEEITCDAVRLGDAEARFAEDVSHVWDQGRGRPEIHNQLLDAFEEGLVRLAGAEGSPALLASVLARVAHENRFAAVYRRILSAASREPAGLARYVLPFIASVPVLISGDTIEQVGRYLRRAFGLLTPGEREVVERTILEIRVVSREDEEYGARCRDRLLSYLPADQVVSGEARASIGELAVARRASLVSAAEEEAWEVSPEAEWLAPEVTEGEAEPATGLRGLSIHAARFGRDFMHMGPTREQADASLAALRELREALAQGTGGGDERDVAIAWTELTAACAALVRGNWLDAAPDVAGFARAILLEAARHELPRPDSDRDESDEEHAFVSPSPRWYAAGGLLRLVRFPSLVDAEVMSAIEQLAGDPCTQIRSEVGRNLTALGRTAVGTFWRLVRRVASAERSRRVVHFTLNGVTPLARRFPGELVPIAHEVFARFRSDTKAAEIRRECLRIVVAAGACDGNPFRDELVDIVVNDLGALPDDAVHLVQTAAEGLTAGPVEPSDMQLDRVRRASFVLLERMARELQARVRGLEERLREVERTAWPPTVTGEIEAIQLVAHELGIRTYFASGSFDEKMEPQNARREKLTDAAKRRFFNEASSLLALFAELAFPDVVHYSLETLSAYVPVDPRAVFLAVGRAVRHGQSSGYQFESLGVSLVVGIVRRYIADYRTLFREDADCRDALVAILNIFVKAGWPEAFDLTGRLEEVFR